MAVKHYVIAAAVTVITALVGHSMLWSCFGVAVAVAYVICREADG